MATLSPHFLSSFLLLTVILYNLHTTAIAARPTTAKTTATNPSAAAFIRASCSMTLYPDLCVSSLSSFTNTIQNNHAKLASAAITVSLSRAQSMASYVSNLLSQDASSNVDSRTTSALRDCSNSLGVAIDNIRGSLNQMQQMSDNTSNGEKFRFQMSSVQTWLSTAMTEEQACSRWFDALPDGKVKTDVRDQVTVVRKFISNALALVQSYGNNVGKPKDIY